MDISSLAQIDVQVPPTVQGEDKIEVRKGNSVVLRFVAKGDKPLTLSIVKDGHPIDRSDNRYSIKIHDIHRKDYKSENKLPAEKQVELSINGATSVDSGDFTCTATNPFGSHTHLTKLVVQEVPSSPRNLRVSSEGSRFATITWTPPSSRNTPIFHYLIYIKRQEEIWGTGKHHAVKVDGSAFTADINELLPANSYHIRITAVNSVGESSPSEALTVHTKGEPPSSPPQNVRATPLSSQSVKVEWSPPDKNTWHGTIAGYYIGYRKESSKTDEEFTFEKIYPSDGSPYTWVVGDLLKFTRYEFVVQAFNNLGTGPLSRMVHALTHEDIPEASPVDFNCISLTSERLDITWSPPPKELSHGRIISYSVVYVSLDKYSTVQPKETRVMSGTSTILSGLRPFTNYSVTVAAATKAGLGKMSQPITCFTEEDVPDVPAAIKGIVSGPNEVVIAWSPPLNTNGILTKYTLYVQMGEYKDVKRKIIPSHSKDYIISNLEEDEEVLVWLSASTRVGEGSPTRKVLVISSSLVPAGIKSVDQEIRVSEGTDVFLVCPYVGHPTPKIDWKKEESDISQFPRWKRQPEGGLLLHDSKLENSGNYSCKVTNKHGSDTVLYNLIIMVPPEAPYLKFLESTSNSVSVTWSLGRDGGAAINRLILTWRPDRDEWQEILMQRFTKTYTLNNLFCGTMYHLYLTPYNEIGQGAASEVVSIRTKGGRPTMPSQHRVINVNSTAAILNLTPFNDTNCPLKHLTIKIKPTHALQWTVASDLLQGNQREYIVEDLRPNTDYEMEVIATNSAGNTMARYSFRTLPLIGDLQSGPQESVSIRDRPWIKGENILLSDPTFIVPVILSCIAFIAILMSAIICVRRRTNNSPSKPIQKQHETKPNNRLAEYHQNDNHYFPTIKKMSIPQNRDVESIDTAPDILYLTSDASTVPSPPNERKTLPSQSESRLNIDDGGTDRIYGISAIRDPSRLPIAHFNHTGHGSPGFKISRVRKGSNDCVEYSETECDRDSRRRNKLNNFNSFAV